MSHAPVKVFEPVGEDGSAEQPIFVRAVNSTTLKPSWRQTAELREMGLSGRIVAVPKGSELKVLDQFELNNHIYVNLIEPWEGKDSGWFWSGNVEVIDPNARVPEYPDTWALGMDFASRIVRFMMSKGYEIHDGLRERNIVYLEGVNTNGTPNADRLDEYNDIGCVISFDEGKPYFAQKPVVATTEPGRYYTKNRMNPKGAFRIAFGQYESAWVVGRHGFDQHEALVQVGEITGHRDDNEDGQRTGDALDTGSDFFVNQHRSYGSTWSIGRSSAGCFVRRSHADHTQFMHLIKKDPRYLQNRWFRFGTTVLNGHEFNRSEFGYKK